MELNDLKIRQLISSLHEIPGDGLSGTLEELKRETGLYIYSFPAMAYRKDRDTCSEFYLYVLERLEKILASFPAGADVRFKTWFNYVLRNQFHNFSYYRNRQKIICSSLEGREEDFFVELFENEETDFGELRECLDSLGEWDRTLIKLYYMPDALEAEEVRFASLRTGLPVGRILEVQRELILAHHEETAKKRELATKIGVINRRLAEWKHRLSSCRTENADEARLALMNELVGKIARAETARYRMVRVLRAPDRKVFKLFSVLFRDRAAAGRRLELARKKLRFGMIALKKQGGGVA